MRVGPTCVQAPTYSAAFYRLLTATPASQVVLVTVPHAEHGFVTDRHPTCASCQPCGTLDAMVQECGYDMAGAMLGHLLGPLRPRVPSIPKHLVVVNQSQFWPATAHSEADIGMDKTAYLYVPESCPPKAAVVVGPASSKAGAARAAAAAAATEHCRILVVYPGCYCSVATSPSGRPSTGMDIMTWGGFGDWAESNNIIVVYPQHATVPCWQGCGRELPNDPGYDLFDTRSGQQMLVVNRMVDWVGDRHGLPEVGALGRV